MAQVPSILQKSLILTHVTVIDTTGSPAKPDMSVVIRDHRIIAISQTAAPFPNDTVELLVSTGFTPMDALQAATLNPVRYLGKEKDLGTIETGKFADLVLLDANPLEDISNTQKIRAVIVNGRYLGREQLDAMMAGVQAAAK